MRPFTLLTLAFVGAGALACNTDTAVSPNKIGDDIRGVADQSSPASDTPVPFKARYDYHLVSVGPGPGCNARRYLEGDGTSTHLGAFTITLSFCGRAGGTLDTGTGTFVAANGDLLEITFHGVGDGGTPVLHFTSYVTFVGGTGRFANATGTATVDGTSDVRTASGAGEWNGMISY